MGNTKAEPKRRGRPPKAAGEVKRNQVNIAFADTTYKAIKESAERNGRSVSSEIDFRLGLSLALEADAGDADTRRLMDFARLASVSIRDSMGPWTEDAIAASRLLGAIETFIRFASPELPEADLWEDNEREGEELMALAQPFADAREGVDPLGTPEAREYALRVISHLARRNGIRAAESVRRLEGRHMLSELLWIMVGAPRVTDPAIAPEGERSLHEIARDFTNSIREKPRTSLADKIWPRSKQPTKGRKHA